MSSEQRNHDSYSQTQKPKRASGRVTPVYQRDTRPYKRLTLPAAYTATPLNNALPNKSFPTPLTDTPSTSLAQSNSSTTSSSSFSFTPIDEEVDRTLDTLPSSIIHADFSATSSSSFTFSPNDEEMDQTLDMQPIPVYTQPRLTLNGEQFSEPTIVPFPTESRSNPQTNYPASAVVGGNPTWTHLRPDPQLPSDEMAIHSDQMVLASLIEFQNGPRKPTIILPRTESGLEQLLTKIIKDDHGKWVFGAASRPWKPVSAGAIIVCHGALLGVWRIEHGVELQGDYILLLCRNDYLCRSTLIRLGRVFYHVPAPTYEFISANMSYS
ncbi:hypothetical protein DFH07DRAFT_764844 [Mycena maculata]|uniref:Uncharacterized protein n=1 Tax=Mycena maculata TaxID=230809 RepID=A0AAD7JCM9_9AGAR|nr:hypothetical protein DFH07DRAFT_771465 [Mycena maculata]KAJ7781828.1 hypothetical protein DFH07DRAFT_764844 [Mycena maculata]